jgi:hypothetical protein
MFNRQNLPSAQVAGAGARVAACPPDAASKFQQGTCSVQSGQPILIGLDQDFLMAQNFNQGAFGALTFVGNNGPNNTPIGTIGILGAGTFLATFSFTASCCWTAAGVYFSDTFVTALLATAPNAAMVAVYAGSGYGQNLIGFGQGNTNRVGLEMLTDPRQNCCPLLAEPAVQAGSPYIVQIEFTTTGIAAPIPIVGAMFGSGS